MSPYSQYPVKDSEKVARFVFSPLSFNEKTQKVKNNIFGHAFTKGCSIQRENLASDDEIRDFKDNFIAKVAGQLWSATLVADCASLRSITLPGQSVRSMCVYDTAEKDNPAHGEFFQSQSHKLGPEDILELRHELFRVFDIENPIKPASYRGGRI